MPEIGNNPSFKPLHQIFGVAKKLSQATLDKVNGQKNQVNVAIQSKESRTRSDTTHADKPQMMMRQYIPDFSQRVLGRYYSPVVNVAGFLSPIGGDQAADYLFKQVNQIAEKLSSTENVMAEAGVKSLDTLKDDIFRAGRVSQALIEQNKWIASIQGGVCAPLGMVGMGLDIPVSLILVLKTVYQTGRAYGFELNINDQEIIQFIFQQIPLEKILEKQSLLLLIRAISSALETQDIQKLQTFVGSQEDLAWVSNLFKEQSIQWDWLAKVPKISMLSKSSPFVMAGVGAVYSWKLIEQVGQHSQHVFSIARDYILTHPTESCSILEAYQRSVKSIKN
ncbi:EcsC family protein [Acinetobacter nectaris]|uniref:EcsC family protein n=1 Tax=Acinetobacter nectaris TaxID=1219382 RepID=UPI001F2386B2|nr:EcsC family protein [Acinetobacter nectaris]MCF9033356.1 EcsC family protein [Acinetobacter nectaris]